jgi:5-methylcytosine-specific restriction endonuclease McrA
MTYAEKLMDPKWQRKRLLIMERDGFQCRDCKAAEKTLHVHHCHYCKGNPWETPDELLLTLCTDCHETRNVLEDGVRYLLGKIFALSRAAAPTLLDHLGSVFAIRRDHGRVIMETHIPSTEEEVS